MPFRVCTRPPTSAKLIEKLEAYCQLNNIVLGIDHQKKNYPDKDWLVRMVSFISRGQDEIFSKGYVPRAA